MKTFNDIKTLTELGHSSEVHALDELRSGVVLVSGRHGSGKSATLEALALDAKMKGRLVVEVVSKEGEGLNFPTSFVLAERTYRSISKNPKRVDLEAARRFALVEAASLLNEGAEVVIFDDIRHAEAALMASYLANAGVLVIASIHNSGEVGQAIKNFAGLPTKLLGSPLSQPLVEAVVHQSLDGSGASPVLSASVHLA